MTLDTIGILTLCTMAIGLAASTALLVAMLYMNRNRIKGLF